MGKTQVIGIDKYRTGIAVSLAEQRRDLNAGLRASAEELAREIQVACPVGTGALRDSIKVVETGVLAHPKVEIRIGDKATYYAPFVEYGTSRMAAHPFVRPAVETFRRKYQGMIESMVSQTWAGK